MINNEEAKNTIRLNRIRNINLGDYEFPKLINKSPIEKKSFHDLDKEDIISLSRVGILSEEKNRSGTCLLYDHGSFIISRLIEGLECLPISEALEKYPWIKEKYWFKVLKKDYDKYTTAIASTVPRGYFIHVKKGVKINFPFQTGFFMSQEKSAMSLHNIVILEEDSELHLITGCLSKHNIKKGVHLAITENYIGKNATLINTMVHNWGPEFEIRPRSATIVDEGGTFMSNYCSLNPAKTIQMSPFTHLKGTNSTAKYTTIILGKKGTFADLGGSILLTGENSRAEIATRAVCQGGIIIQTGLLIGAAPNCRAHVDCSGLMMSDEGLIEAIPGLRARHSGARMSHEASIGRIAPGEVCYLQSKGMTEEEAISMIVRGFLDIGIKGLSPELDNALSEIGEISGHGEE